MPRNPDRTELCQFTFSDGRRCTMPQFPDDLGFCYYHGQQCRERLHAKEAGRQVSRFLETDIMTACDLSCTLSALFGATAEGLIKPKRAKTLAYLAGLMLQTHKLAKSEFLEAYEQTWPEVVSHGPAFSPPVDQLNTPVLVPDPPANSSPESELAATSSAECPSPSSDSCPDETEEVAPDEPPSSADNGTPA